jgi:hypothetical protein
MYSGCNGRDLRPWLGSRQLDWPGNASRSGNSRCAVVLGVAIDVRRGEERRSIGLHSRDSRSPRGTCHRPAGGIPRARPGLVRRAAASLHRLPVLPDLLPAQRTGADARIRQLRGRRSRLGRLASTDTRGGCISIPASLPGISRALQEAFPDLPLCGLRIADIGFGSTVVETNDGIIGRVARTAAAARGHAVEAAVLPALAPMLPAAVPVPAYFCPPGAQLPFGAIGYRRLPGAARTDRHPPRRVGR